MATIVKGTQVASHLTQRLQGEIEELKSKGISPCAAIVRVGENPSDMAYERGAVKKLESLGIRAVLTALPGDIRQDAFLKEFRRINEDRSVNGILLLRPLPRQLNETEICGAISPEKDVDAIHPANLCKILAGDETGFAPCTPEAVMEILKDIGQSLQGKKVTVIGRSLVVGKPLALLALNQNATVTVCHSRTVDLPSVCRNAEILLVAVGKKGLVTADYISPGATVIDVGINVDEEGKLCGDVDFESAEAVAEYLTPVPGGVGSVTTSVLAGHVIRAAKMQHGL